MTPTIRGGGWDEQYNANLRVWHRGMWHLPTRKNRNRDPSWVVSPDLGFRCMLKFKSPVKEKTWIP